MQENNFTELFEISKFTQDEAFQSLIYRFENDRKPDQLNKRMTKVMTVEEFIKETEPKEDLKKSNQTIKDK